jgi:carboxypeptidase family protein/carboxypeptidase-like protein/Big-like domain-containing protein
MTGKNILKSFLFFVIILVLFVACSKKDDKSSSSSGKDSSKFPEYKRTTISGIVQTPDLKDHSGILVYAEGKSLMAYTDKAGQFTFLDVPVGSYSFKARMDSYITSAVGSINVERTGKGQIPPVRLQTVILEKIPEKSQTSSLGDLFGRIELENADPASGVLVQIKGTLFKSVTDDEGMYRFYNLEPGAYILSFSRAGYSNQTFNVKVLPGEPAFVTTIRIYPVQKTEKNRKIYGTIDMYDLKGNLQNSFGTVIVALEGTSYIALPDSSGKFVFDKISPGKYTITANAPSFINRGKIDIDLTELEFTNVSIIMDEAPSDSDKKGLLRGIVKLEDENDHSGVSVAIAGTSIVSVSDSSGAYSLNDIPGGEYTILAQAEGYLPVRIEGIQITPGEEVELEEILLEMRVDLPQVIYTDPSDNQKDVMIQKITPLFVRFSKQMKPESLKKAFSISPDVDYKIFSGRQNRYSDFDLLYVELPGSGKENSLRFDTHYRVSISTAATDFEGLNLEEDYEFDFNTGKASVTGSMPADGDQNALLTQQRPIFIYFNAAIDPETVSKNIVSFSPESNTVPRVRVYNDHNSGWSYLQIYAKLTPGKKYRLKIGSGVRTEGGSYISNLPYAISFKTTEGTNLREFAPR